ncbi:MAG: N-succinylarginine dihydrolase [Myxococcales bacterium]|nr:N-succinylarginine dihydrolase [Myxococcales bacterium]
MALREFNFDGIVGPTHNYAGLSHGNVASTSNRGAVSRPRDAALQGLSKMKALMDRGLGQGVIPPLARPNMSVLRRLGFAGTEGDALARAAQEAPALLAAVYSASSMWTANAATVFPGPDTLDGRTHFVPANLKSVFHRSLEPLDTARVLRAVFSGPAFAHHEPLPGSAHLGDEGAANHTRLETAEGVAHLFVYGRQAFGGGPAPSIFPARQTLEASESVARIGRLRGQLGVFAQQNPEAIDAGVFHNDVIAVGNGNVLLYHEHAFLDSPGVLQKLRDHLGEPFQPIMIGNDSLSVDQAVSTYLFNSQLVTVEDGSMLLVAPTECETNPSTRQIIDGLVDGPSPIGEALFFDLRESMRNGGGPACLRLRVPLDAAALETSTPGTLLTEERYTALRAWVERHYRETLSPDDLRDPALPREVETALDELTSILGLGSIYPFQNPSIP